MNPKPTVLFLCEHNAGRSQMAAGWLRHLADGAVEVMSGGSNPGASVNPAAVDAMAEVGIDISTRQPRRWTDDDLGSADIIVTMGCGERARSSQASTTRTGSCPTPQSSRSRSSGKSATRSRPGYGT